jgi:DNA-binding NarL/FixJ family response regulator
MTTRHPDSRIRVLLVDDHFFVRMGLRATLNRETDLRVVGEAGSAMQAVALFVELKPDVVLMDARLPDRHGSQAVAAILAKDTAARILMLSIEDTEEDIYRAMDAGALGYVTKAVGREELLSGLREVAQGRRYLPAVLNQRLTARRERKELTPRELEVLRLVAAGVPNKSIADELGISETTVRIHLTHAFKKLGAADRSAATSIALRRGLIRLE